MELHVLPRGDGRVLADPSHLPLTRSTVDVLFDTAYAKLCHSVSRWLGGDRSTAEQVVQEAFLALWAHRDGVHAETAEAYLWKITVNEARTIATRRAKEARLVDRAARQGFLPGAAVDGSCGGIEGVADRADMRRLVEALPWDQRVVIDLHYYLDWPDSKIAAHLGCPAVTVRARLHRARRSLRADMSARNR